MKNCPNQNNSFSNNMSTNEKSEFDIIIQTETIEEDNCSTATNSNTSNYKFRTKIRKRSNDICYTLSYYEKYGNIYVSHYTNKIFIAKIRKVNFDDNFQELFDKGKSNLGEYFKEEVNNIPDISFWYQRYYYYKRFDEGIKMDYESWWSVTPEELAKYTATLCEGKVVADGFCGSGGNVIQFSKFCKKVYAIDIDEKKLELCRNNAKVYQCEDNIEFIKSDYLKMIDKLKVDYVFLSPPWGGIKYKDSDVYCIKELMTPNIYDIVRVSLNIAKNIIFFLPRTLLLDELFEILSYILNGDNSKTGDRIFFDVHVLKSAKKIKALMIIFGYDIKEINQSDLGEYLTFNYPNISARNLQILITIAKILGNYKFLQTEYYLRRQLVDSFNSNGFNLVPQSIDPDSLVNYFCEIMTEQEKIKLKSFNIMKQGAAHRINKNSYKKNYTNSNSLSPKLHKLNQQNLCKEKKESKKTTFHVVKEIQIEYFPQTMSIRVQSNSTNNLNSLDVLNISPINNKQNSLSGTNKLSSTTTTIPKKRIITKK